MSENSVSSRIYDWLMDQNVGFKFTSYTTRKKFNCSHGAVSGFFSRLESLKVIVDTGTKMKDSPNNKEHPHVIWELVDKSIPVGVYRRPGKGSVPGKNHMSIPRSLQHHKLVDAEGREVAPKKPVYARRKHSRSPSEGLKGNVFTGGPLLTVPVLVPPQIPPTQVELPTETVKQLKDIQDSIEHLTHAVLRPSLNQLFTALQVRGATGFIEVKDDNGVPHSYVFKQGHRI